VDPFVTLDQEGVGELVEMAVERAARRAPAQARHLRRARRRPGLDRLLPPVGLDYVSSCSPFRVPIARLAAAQAALKDGAK
jgi:pyruvate,orthophosphate dikinase